jgi:hypothetical protein
MKSFHLTKLHTLGISLAAATLLAGCQEEVIVNNTHTTRGHISERQSDVCSLTLNRGVLFSTVPLVDPAGPTQVLAGFDTHWSPGSPPFACDRLQQAVGQGAINFDVAALRRRSPALPVPFRGALLEISNFVPVAGNVNVIENEPWGLSFGTGWLGSRGRVHTECTFKVKAITESWAAGAAGWAQPLLATHELTQPARSIFTVPRSGVVDIDVSAEVGAALASGVNGNGFSIEPVGIGMDFKSTSHCSGLFTVRLRTFHGPD